MPLIANFSLPAGVVQAFAGLTPPEGWLFMDGAEIFRNDYPALFLEIGEVYGSGDGEYTFNLPDARGRSLFGRDDMNGTAANRLTIGNGLNGSILGAAGGGQTATLSTAQIASHTHTEKLYGQNGNSNFALTSNAISGAQTTQSSGATGSGGSHSNMPPALIINYIIKT